MVLQLARQSPAGVILLDKHFGQQLVMRTVEELLRHASVTGLVVWGTAIGEAEALRYLQAGVRGLLKKSASLATIERCLAAVGQGGMWVEDAMAAPAAGEARGTLPQLTPRESQVLELVRQGMRNREIATALGIRPGTVKIHLRHIFEKTGIHGRFSLALNLMAARTAAQSRHAEVA
ncbi:MAG: response regulator transcription factor [Acidobacteriota bacterium]